MLWDFPGGPVGKKPPANEEGLGLVPDQETRFHVLQLRPGTHRHIFLKRILKSVNFIFVATSAGKSF